MRTRVTNLSRGARGFHTADGGTRLLDAGASAILDLADHPAHHAWVASGEVVATPEADPEPTASAMARGKPPARAASPRSRDG